MASTTTIGETGPVSPPPTPPSPSDPADFATLRGALEAGGVGTWHWDRLGDTVVWDSTMEAMAGLAPGAFGGTLESFIELIHPDDRERAQNAINEALDARSAYGFEHRLLLPDGAARWIECRGQVLTAADGSVLGTVGTSLDISERKAAELERERLLQHATELTDRLDQLQQIGGLLAAAVSVKEVGGIVIELLRTANTAGSRMLWLLEPESDNLELVASVGLDDSTALRFQTISPDDHLPATDAIRRRCTIQSSSHDDTLQRYPSIADARRSTAGFVAVPLCVHDECLGVVAVGHDAASLPDLDIQFLEAAANYIAQTIERVRLSDSVARWAHESLAAADRERRRREQVEFIGQLTAAATAAADHGDLMERITSGAVPRLGDWCALHFLATPHANPETVISHVDPDKLEWALEMRERFPYDPEGRTGVPAVIRSGKTEHLDTIDASIIDELVERSGRERSEVEGLLDTLGLTSMITAPLATKHGIIGAIQFVSAESGRRYDSDDVALAEAVAGRVADALHASWLTEQHRRIATSLQRALLPPELPTLPGMDVAARYWPAGATSEVGGDFYDIFPIVDATWALTIGDVCGTGPDAAAVTSIARHTIRAAARHGYTHVDVLDWANNAVLHSDRNLFCTVCYGTMDHRDGQWHLSSSLAGHPLPIVRRHDGTTETFGTPGTLLGVFPEVTHTVDEITLESGDVVVFYTDGVTDLPDPHGISPDELLELIEGFPDTSSADAVADAIHASLLDRVPDTSRLDDVALVVLRAQ